MEHFDAIVLGTGGVGSSAVLHLAERGLRVVGLDRFPGGHDRGSSHGETRIIRQAYFEHADYVPLLLSAYKLWSELEQLTNQTLFHQVGLLQIGPPDGEVIRGVQKAAELHGLNVETLSAEQIRQRYPAFTVPAGMCGVFEPKAGYLRVEQAVLAHLSAATSAGAELRTGVEVQSWRAVGSGVEVMTNCGTFAADKLIITAGAWASQLLADLNLKLQVLRKHLYWFGPTKPICHEDTGCPTFLYELPTGVFYGFPQRDALGMKVAEHSGGEVVTDPLKDPRNPDAADLARVQFFREQCLPGLGNEVRRQSVCFYTMSPDGNFIIDRHPEHRQVCFAAGLSGHGFKFTSVLGEILADLAIDGITKHPVDFLSLARFDRT